MAYTLKQFKEITAGMPDDTTIEIEAYFTPDTSGSVPTFSIIANRNIKRVVLLPERVFISDGENDLHVEHKARRPAAGTGES